MEVAQKVRRNISLLRKCLGYTLYSPQIPLEAIQNVVYFEKLPSFETVYNFFREYTISAGFWTFVNDYGIFQFWNKEYIQCLSEEIKAKVGSELVLEVAAGDAMLSYWLRQHGINAKATDSGEWYERRNGVERRARLKPRAEVEIIDAVSAIRKYIPKMVIASWLPLEGKVDIAIFNEKIPIIVLIGEEDGATGSAEFWDRYWEKVGCKKEYGTCDRWNIARTDFFSNTELWHHSYTAFYTLKG